MSGGGADTERSDDFNRGVEHGLRSAALMILTMREVYGPGQTYDAATMMGESLSEVANEHFAENPAKATTQ